MPDGITILLLDVVLNGLLQYLAPRIFGCFNRIYIRITLNDLDTQGLSLLLILLVRFSLNHVEFQKNFRNADFMSQNQHEHSRQKCLPNLIILVVHEWAFLGQADNHKY